MPRSTRLNSSNGLAPALRTAHVRDAHRIVPRIHAAKVFVDQFRFASGGGDAGGLCNQRGRHQAIIEGDFTTETQRHRGFSEKKTAGDAKALPGRSR